MPGPEMPPRPLRRKRRLRASWGMLLWLTLVWVVLWGELSLANVVVGLGLAILITSVMQLPLSDFDGSFRPLGVVILGARFIWAVVCYSVAVSLLGMAIKTRKVAVVQY